MLQSPDQRPLTVVVRRRIRAGREIEFESEMNQFVKFALTFPGHRGIAILPPPHNEIREYTVVDHFENAGARQLFKSSLAYQQWMRRLQAVSEDTPQFEELEGLAGWFQPATGRSVSPPSKVKMAIVTFVGVYPLTASLPPLYQSLLPSWHPLVLNVVVTATIVGALSWLIMPPLTRWLAPWLFPSKPIHHSE